MLRACDARRDALADHRRKRLGEGEGCSSTPWEPESQRLSPTTCKYPFPQAWARSGSIPGAESSAPRQPGKRGSADISEPAPAHLLQEHLHENLAIVTT